MALMTSLTLAPPLPWGPSESPDKMPLGSGCCGQGADGATVALKRTPPLWLLLFLLQGDTSGTKVPLPTSALMLVGGAWGYEMLGRMVPGVTDGSAGIRTVPGL